jgi:S1-C subfamily serine protease
METTAILWTEDSIMLRRQSTLGAAALLAALGLWTMGVPAIAQDVGAGGAAAGAGAAAGGQVGGNVGGNVGGSAAVGGNASGNAGSRNAAGQGAAGARFNADGNIVPGVQNGAARNGAVRSGAVRNGAGENANAGPAENSDDRRGNGRTTTGTRRGRARAEALRDAANGSDRTDGAADLIRERTRRQQAADRTDDDIDNDAGDRQDRRNRATRRSDRLRDLREMNDDLDGSSAEFDGESDLDASLGDDDFDADNSSDDSSDDASTEGTSGDTSDDGAAADDDGDSDSVSRRIDRLERLLERLSSRFDDDQDGDDRRNDRRDDRSDRRDDRADRREERQDRRRDWTISAEDLDALGFQFQSGADADLTLGDFADSSVAARLGLEEGDVITSVNGEAVTSTSEFVDALAELRPGSRLSLGISRNGEETTIRRTLGGWFFQDAADPRGNQQETDADGVAPLTAERLQSLGFRFTDEASGELVLDQLSNSSVAARMRLREGDVITSINGAPVGTMDEFVDAFADLRPGSRLQVGIIRDGEARSISTSLNRPFFEGRVSSASRISTTANPELIPGLGVRFDASADGALTAGDITEGSVAAQWGLRTGDRVISVNGLGVSSVNDLQDILGSDPSQAGSIRVLRDGQVITLSAAAGTTAND